LEVGIFDVGNLRGIVLVRIYIEEGRLILGERGVLLGPVDLRKKSVSVIAVKMQKRELCAAAADIEFGRAVVEPGAQHACETALEPVRKKERGRGSISGRSRGKNWSITALRR
jgi:hypothetical protein